LATLSREQSHGLEQFVQFMLNDESSLQNVIVIYTHYVQIICILGQLGEENKNNSCVFLPSLSEKIVLLSNKKQYK
jgi:hypothetical protein